jgi:isopenicillin N synthase-like dioxygenase
MEALAGALLRIFATALHLSEDYFEDKIDKHGSNCCAFNYPEQNDEPLPQQLRAGEHTDWGTLTILYQNPAPGGLQVR